MQRTELWLKAKQEKLIALRTRKSLFEESACRDQSYYDFLSTSIKNSSRYSAVESKLPEEARASRRSKSRTSMSRESVCQKKRAASGYSEMYSLRKQALGESFHRA